MKDEIIKMAREAGYQHPDAVGKCEDFAYFDLERFFHMAQTAEREACYTIAKFNQSNHLEHLTPEQIRARGQA